MATATRLTSVVLYVSPTSYRCMWASILAVRVVSILYLTASTGLYMFLAKQDMAYYASLLGPYAATQLTPMGIGLALLAAAHAHAAAKMLVFSCRYGELVYDQRRAPRPQIRSSPSDASKHSHSSSGRQGPRFQEEEQTETDGGDCVPWRVTAWQMWRNCFGRRGFFGVKSQYFDARLTVREIAETLAQTAQLYTSSELIAKHWITNLYAAIVAVNCWSTPLIQFLCRRKLHQLEKERGQQEQEQQYEQNHQTQYTTIQSASSSPRTDQDVQGIIALERLLCLATDLVLDLTLSMVIPAIIFAPYVSQFDLPAFSFPTDLLYDDVWFVNFVYESQQVFVVNFYELVLTLFPYWSIYSCCFSIRVLIRRKENSPTITAIVPVSTQHPVFAVRAKARNLTSARRRDAIIPADQGRAATYVRHRSYLTTVHAVCAVWGLVILALHLSANHAASTNSSTRAAGCKRVLRPWFTAKPACSVVEVNCYAKNQSLSPIDTDLAQLYTASVAVLNFVHCPALRMPRGIQDFPYLLGLGVHNSTITEWDKTVTLSVATQKRLSFVMMTQTNMSSFPSGLTTQLPATLLDIEIIRSNLSSLPADLDRYWHPLIVLYLEYCAFTQVPSVLGRLHVDDLSLVGNQITHFLPEADDSNGTIDWPADVAFFSLTLGHNPLVELPENPIGVASGIAILSLESTEVRTIPAWVTAAGIKVFLKNSAFCRLQSEATVANKFGDDAMITCVGKDPHGEGVVPFNTIVSFLLDVEKP